MDKKYIQFLKKVLKVDGFISIQIVLLPIFFYFLLDYVYWSFQKPSDEAYAANFESYSGVLALVYVNKRRGKTGGGLGIGRIVIEGDKGRIEFWLNRYSTYNRTQDLPFIQGKERFTLTHYNNYIVSCVDDHGGVCTPKCDSPVNCEKVVIQENREACFWVLRIILFTSIFFLLAAFIQVLIKLKEGSNNV